MHDQSRNVEQAWLTAQWCIVDVGALSTTYCNCASHGLDAVCCESEFSRGSFSSKRILRLSHSCCSSPSDRSSIDRSSFHTRSLSLSLIGFLLSFHFHNMPQFGPAPHPTQKRKREDMTSRVHEQGDVEANGCSCLFCAAPNEVNRYWRRMMWDTEL